MQEFETGAENVEEIWEKQERQELRKKIMEKEKKRQEKERIFKSKQKIKSEKISTVNIKKEKFEDDDLFENIVKEDKINLYKYLLSQEKMKCFCPS